jgi:hypothetical protein
MVRPSMFHGGRVDNQAARWYIWVSVYIKDDRMTKHNQIHDVTIDYNRWILIHVVAYLTINRLKKP